jgi:hypothetical protein
VFSGALLLADGTARAPLNTCFRSPGEWHQMDLWFRAPRFDAAGRKVANARVVRALVDDVLIHEEVELPGAAGGLDEVATGPLVFRPLTAAQVALNSIRLKPTEVDPPGDGWRPLAEDEDLAGWRTIGGATATNEGGELVLGGAQGALVTESVRGDVEVACRVKVSSTGQSGLWLRAGERDGALTGYCVRINADAPLAEHTGSLAGFSALRVQLVGPETWAWLHASAREEPGGTRVVVRLNGVEVANVLDARPDRPKSGGIALEQHHDGSRAVFEGLRAR